MTRTMLPLILSQTPPLPSGFEVLHNQLPSRIFPQGSTSACDNLAAGLFEGKFSPITCIVQQIDVIARDVMYDGLVTVTAMLRVPITLAATLAVIFLGYTMLSGRTENAYDPIKQILTVCLTVVFINGFPTWGLKHAERIIIHMPPDIGAKIYPVESRTEQAIKASLPDHQTMRQLGYSRDGYELPNLNMRIPLMLDAFLVDGIANSIAVALNLGVGKNLQIVLSTFSGLRAALRNTVGLRGCTENRLGDQAEAINEEDTGLWQTLMGHAATAGTAIAATATAAVSQFVMSIVSVTAAVVTLIMVLYWVLSTAMMYISNYLRGVLMLTLTPVFGVFFLFNKTRDIAQKWIQSLISTALLFLLLSATISIFAAIMDTTLSSLANPAECTYSPLVFVLLLFILYMVLTQMTRNLPTITQELTGSSGQSPIDIIGQSLSLAAQAGQATMMGRGLTMLTNRGLLAKADEARGALMNKMKSGRGT